MHNQKPEDLIMAELKKAANSENITLLKYTTANICQTDNSKELKKSTEHKIGDETEVNNYRTICSLKEKRYSLKHSEREQMTKSTHKSMNTKDSEKVYCELNNILPS